MIGRILNFAFSAGLFCACGLAGTIVVGKIVTAEYDVAGPAEVAPVEPALLQEETPSIIDAQPVEVAEPIQVRIRRAGVLDD